MSDSIAALAVVSLFAVAGPAFGDVVDVAPNGFTVKHEVGIAAMPDVVWKAMLDVGSWWNMEHSYSRDPASMTIDARPGGCFCEKLPNGGVVHGTVVFIQPNQMLRLSAALGPLQADGLAGSLTFRIVPATVPGSSRLEMTYVVGGYRQGGFERIAPAVNGVMIEQVGRLKAYVETGKPAAPKP